MHTHNAPAIYEKEIEAKRKMYVRPDMPLAPKDKIQDLRKEPQWLLPELRSWMSFPEVEREAKIEKMMSRKDLGYEDKRKMLRFVLTQEEDRRLAIKICSFVWPRGKNEAE